MLNTGFHTPFSDIQPVDFSYAPEMIPYLTEPTAMYIGAPGKSGYLNLRFELNDNGRSILRGLDRRVPIVVQQALYFDEQMPKMPCVYILSSGGQNVDGDRYRIDISVGQGAMAWISTGAATKLAEMKFNYAGLSQTITLEDNAYLEYIPEQTIPCRNTRYISDTRLVVSESATIFYSEIFTGGRRYYGNGEDFEFDILSVCTTGLRPDGNKLFREKFVIEPSQTEVHKIGIMADYSIFANVIIMTPQNNCEQIYNQVEPYVDTEHKVAIGISKLPHQAGLIYRVIGNDISAVKSLVRQLCSIVRQVIKCKPLPNEFPWR